MDPAMMGAMGGMPPPPMDPTMMGGAPPMDPAMMGAMGGMPPTDPAMMGGMPPPPMDPAAMGAAPPPTDPAAAGQPAPNAPPMKVDMNAELALIKKMMAKVLDSLNINVKAQEMVVTPNDIQQLTPKQEKVKAGSIPGIEGIQPIQGAMPTTTTKTADDIIAEHLTFVRGMRMFQRM